MRLKNINIDERSSTFSDENQKKTLKEMSSSVNKLGEVFDSMVNLETFILQSIYQELSILIGIKNDKEKIVQENGLDSYLEDYFKPAAYKMEEKIISSIKDWDGENDRLSTNEIKETIVVLKEVSNFLKISGNKFQSLSILNDMIDEFGYFQICKAVFTGDIVDRVVVLTKLKTEIKEVFSEQSITKTEQPKRKKLTIDDL